MDYISAHERTSMGKCGSKSTCGRFKHTLHIEDMGLIIKKDNIHELYKLRSN